MKKDKIEQIEKIEQYLCDSVKNNWKNGNIKNSLEIKKILGVYYG